MTLQPKALPAVADSVAPDGAALLGLGYGSDADSQDSGASGRVPQAPRAGKSQAETQEDRASRAADSGQVGDTAGGPSAASRQAEEREEERKDPAAPITFVKGQRCKPDIPELESECMLRAHGGRGGGKVVCNMLMSLCNACYTTCGFHACSCAR